MNYGPKISFIIPCYNHGDFIRSAVESVKNVNIPHEIIVVDDGSTQAETIRVISELETDGCVVIRQENRGPAAARNSGIEASSAPYILPLDSDNKIRPAFASKAVEVLDSEPEIDIVHGDFKYFGALNHRAFSAEFDIRKMLYTNYIDTCALYRREVWLDSGGYDENPICIEDWDFWMKAYVNGKNFRHLSMVGFDYGHSGESRVVSQTRDLGNWRGAKEDFCSKYGVLIKEYYDDYHSWDFHGAELRRRPFRTLLRLILNAMSRRLHDRVYRLHRP